MIKTFTLTLAALALAAPVYAGTSMCSKAAASKFQPKSKLEAQLKSEGVTVRRVKTEGGCYEVYGLKDGKKYNAAFNAETLVKAANAEAGED